MKNQVLTFLMLFYATILFSATSVKSPIYVSNNIEIIFKDRAITLRAGTPVVIEAMQSYNSKNLTVGQSLNVRVKFNIVSEKKTLIAAGALGSALITKIRKKGIFGKSGMMELQVQSVQAVDGQQILLSGIPLIVEGKNKKALAWGLAIGAGLFTFGIGLIAGLFIKGKEAEFRAGTNFNSNVASDVEIEAN